MRELWLIARFEFWRLLRQRRFLYVAFGLPLLIVLSAAIPILIEATRGEPQVGYVDRSGLLADPVPPAERRDVGFVPFASEEAGRAALAAEEIQSLWLIPADYVASGRLQVVVPGEVRGQQERAMRALLRANLLRDLSPERAERLQEPAIFTFRLLESGQQVRQGIELIFALAVPFGMAVGFAFSISFSAGLLASAVAEEKENRLMEILATSTRLWPLIGGKVLGLGGLSLVQISVWGAGLMAAVLLFALRGELPRGVPVPWDVLAWSLLFFVLAYLLDATLLVGIGVAMPGTREAQQLSSIVGILSFLPIWFFPIVVEQPAGVVARLLTFIPLTAPILVPVRLALGRITVPELLLSLLLLVLALALSIRGVSALFRATMLHYGRRPSLRALFGRLRPATLTPPAEREP